VTTRHRALTVSAPLPLQRPEIKVRLQVLPTAIRQEGKPRVYGYVWADQTQPGTLDDRQDLVTCWAWEQGWLLSTVFRDTRTRADTYNGPGLIALLDVLRSTDSYGVVLPGNPDQHARQIARQIKATGVRVLSPRVNRR
jgi:hypothetical protein